MYGLNFSALEMAGVVQDQCAIVQFVMLRDAIGVSLENRQFALIALSVSLIRLCAPGQDVANPPFSHGHHGTFATNQ